MLSRILASAAFAVVSAGTLIAAPGANEAATTDIPKIQREFRGVWVATVANIDWPSTRGLSAEEQKKELIAILDKAVELNLNAIVLQVRPACDALYESKLEPWSPFLTGVMGKAPEPYYDPLQFAVEECHKRGLELHAWFNPYRALHPSYKGEIPPNHISKTHPEVVKKYGQYLWLDPGAKVVQDQSLAVMLDVVRRYDVDGVHMDDYFYPYPEKDKKTDQEIPFPDEETYAAYKKAGGTMSLQDWRRDNVNKFVKRLYDGVKKEKPWVKVGLSPFGIWKPGYPPQIKGFNQYEKLYADARLWFQKGWVDYFTPQLYWRIAAPDQSYVLLLKWWWEQNLSKRHLWPGLYTSRVGEKGKNAWQPDEIINQIKWSRILTENPGQVHFSMAAFMSNRLQINEELTTSGAVYAQPALVPALPWLDDVPPAAPKVRVEPAASGEALKVVVEHPKPKDVRVWTLRAKRGTKWEVKVLPAAVSEYEFVAGENQPLPSLILVTAVDRCGNESKEVRVKP